MNALQDHVKKLFWAFWGPRFSGEPLLASDFEESRFIASRIHEQRMQGLYVDVEGDVVSSPAEAISPAYAATLIRMAESRLALESSRGHGVSTEESRRDTQWLFEATDDPLRHPFVFSKGSLDKLAELGSATPMSVIV